MDGSYHTDDLIHMYLKYIKVFAGNNGAPGTLSFEHLLAWLDQLRVNLEEDN